MRSQRGRVAALVAGAGLLILSGGSMARAQQASAPVLPMRQTAVTVDSGEVAANPGGGGVAGPVVVYQTELAAPDSHWIRLEFGGVLLAGPMGTERAARLRITSLQDGAVQELDAEAIAQWGGMSAYFNGPAVRLEVIAWPETGTSRVVVSRVWGHEPDLQTLADICPSADDRIASNDPRVCRVLGFGGTIGTGFAFNDTNHFYLTAGHVQPSTGSVIHYNVPLSNSDGTINFPPPQDQYPIDPLSVQRQTSGTGNDWCYFGVFPNSNTGLQPNQVYGGLFHTLATTIPAPSGQTVRVTGHGSTTGFQLPFEMSYTQTTHTGPLTTSGATVRYQVDTTGGNSGSAVELVSTGEVLAIHYLAGCDAGGTMDLGNQGTPITNANLQFAIGAPVGVCRTGKGTVSGTIYAIGDQANNFGTASASPLRFAKIAQIGSRWQGMTWSSRRNAFLACDSNLGLYAVTQAGAMTSIATITGTSGQVINGLGYDPVARVLWGYAASVGQLYTIDATTGAATPVGAPQGGLVTGLEWDGSRNTLWGIENTTQSKLVSINTATGARTVVGNLGTTSIAQCHGLAFNAADGNLYTINATSSILYRVNPLTGVATSAGVTLGVFPNQFGMAVPNPGPSCPQDFNGDGGVDPDDLGDFINCYFALPPCPGADFNGDGGVDPDDLGDFINAYFGAPC